MPEQIDIFGNSIELTAEPKQKGGRQKYKTMVEMYGTTPGYVCGECIHCLKGQWHDKTYRKCELWILSHSSATDIRKSQIACKKFGKGEEG